MTGIMAKTHGGARKIMAVQGAWLPAVLLAGLLALIAHAAVAQGADPAQARRAAQAKGFVQVEGRRFVGADGTTFHVRGIGLGNWLVPEGYMFKFKAARSPTEIARLVETALGPAEAEAFWTRFRDDYVSEADVAFLARAGFNTLRVPLHYRLFMPDATDARAEQAHRFEGPGWALLERFMGWCRKHGVKVILDMHAAPGGQTGINHDDGTGYPLMFYVRREWRRSIALWVEIARRYRDDPAILGYEVLNEPISTYSDEDQLNPLLEPYYREAVAAIRAVDPHHVIFLAGAQWDQNLRVFGPPFAPNLAYVYHQFWSSTRQDAVQDYANFSLQNNVPMLLGEAGEFNNRWNRDYRLLNERNGMGWSFWTYKNLASPTTIASIRAPKGWERISALGGMAKPDLAAAGLTRESARAILMAYLEAIRFENVEIRPCYLRSLDLAPELEAACAAERAAGRGD